MLVGREGDSRRLYLQGDSGVYIYEVLGVNRTITISQFLVTARGASIWSRRGDLGTSGPPARDAGGGGEKGKRRKTMYLNEAKV